jgi:hypothetical protein
MRKQYYFRPSDAGVLAWDVDRLVQLSAGLPRRMVALDAIGELDEVSACLSSGPSTRSLTLWKGRDHRTQERVDLRR